MNPEKSKHNTEFLNGPIIVKKKIVKSFKFEEFNLLEMLFD